jgi:hypothetical protein
MDEKEFNKVKEELLTNELYLGIIKHPDFNRLFKIEFNLMSGRIPDIQIKSRRHKQDYWKIIYAAVLAVRNRLYKSKIEDELKLQVLNFFTENDDFPDPVFICKVFNLYDTEKGINIPEDGIDFEDWRVTVLMGAYHKFIKEVRSWVKS